MSVSLPSQAATREVFVLMPFGHGEEARLHQIRYNNVIRPAVEGAGRNLRCVRADEIAATGVVTDKVLRRIVESELVIADLTGFSPNVMYELGVRHTCRQRTILMAPEKVNLPFDLQHLEVVEYSDRIGTHEDAVHRLKLRVLACLDEQVVDSPFLQLFASVGARIDESEIGTMLSEAVAGNRVASFRDMIETLAPPTSPFVDRDLLMFVHGSLARVAGAKGAEGLLKVSVERKSRFSNPARLELALYRFAKEDYAGLASLVAEMTASDDPSMSHVGEVLRAVVALRQRRDADLESAVARLRPMECDDNVRAQFIFLESVVLAAAGGDAETVAAWDFLKKECRQDLPIERAPFWQLGVEFEHALLQVLWGYAPAQAKARTLSDKRLRGQAHLVGRAARLFRCSEAAVATLCRIGAGWSKPQRSDEIKDRLRAFEVELFALAGTLR